MDFQPWLIDIHPCWMDFHPWWLDFLAYRIYDIEYRFFGGCPKFSFEEKNLDWDPKKICAGVFEEKNRGGR